MFGCPTYAHIKQGKLEPRALKGVFLGYQEGVKGYKLWCTDLKPLKAIIRRDIVFNEAEMFKPSESVKMENSHHDNKDQKTYFKVEPSNPNAKQKITVESGPEAGRNISESECESEEDQCVKSYQLVRDREKKVIRPLKKYAYAYLIAFALTAAHELDTDELKTYSEVVNRDDSGK